MDSKQSKHEIQLLEDLKSFFTKEMENNTKKITENNRKNEWSNGLVFKALDSQSRDPMFKSSGFSPRSTQPFILPSLIK